MKIGKAQKQYFTRQLMHWHETGNDRSLPWKSEKDPYKIWLSEIILQQTRALQGLPYYLRFIEAYPTIRHLAAAEDGEVFRIWQGLGYYNRCKNMLATARFISGNLKGKFPDNYGHILNLKGIGPYTAAAISSFAYGLPHAVLDGNVYRVLSRYFGIDTPIDSTEGKSQFSALADGLLDKDNSADYNQSIMDLGATVCLPKNPVCTSCPLRQACFAFKQNLQSVLPVKAKKITVKDRYFNYILITDKNRIWIRKRENNDIWQNLHEPFLIESAGSQSAEQLFTASAFQELKVPFTPEYLGTSTQRLTHQLIRTTFYHIETKAKQIKLDSKGLWIPLAELNKYAFPKTIVSFLEKIFYF